MVRTNLQEFAGDVHVLSNLQVGSNLFANDLAANVLNVIGSIGANLFVGDGGLLSNIATTLDDIIDQGNTVSNTIIFVSGNDATSNTGIITRSNVGISISNTEPTGEYQLTVGSNIFMNTHASNVLSVVGRVGADYFVGDGGLLSNIATTLDQIVDQGNTISNTVILESGHDVTSTSNIGLISRENVGISVSNSNPTGEFQFGVGSNLFVNTYSSNVLTVEGNVLAQKLSFGTATVTSAYNLSHVTAQGSSTDQTISLTNATTGLAVTSNATVGGNVTAETVISSANVEVGDRLKFASNVFVDDLRVADLAANLVTYDKTTGELMDSGGLFANKLAVVSAQPPSALSANVTTIAKHGTYTVTTSSLAAYSNAWNAFDGDSAVEWTTSTSSYNSGGYTYSGTSNLFAGNYIQTGASSAGDWLAIEFPYRTTLRHMKLTPPAEKTQYPASANVYATNDSLTWTELVNWSGVDPGDQQSNVQTIIVNATESFKKYAMVVTKTNGSNTVAALAEWKLFAESFSIDGGQISMAQQPVTGGETTMEQSGPHSRDPKAVPLKKYPEIVFDASKADTFANSNAYTQAGYVVSASSSLTASPAYLAFDGSTSTIWHAQYPYYTENGGVYDPGNAPGALGTYSGTLPSHELVSGYAGEYITLSLPNKIKMSKISINTRVDTNLNLDQTQSAEVIVVVGSHDGSTWEFVDTHTVSKYPDDNTVPYTFNVNTSTYYEHVGLICTNTGPTDSVYNTAWAISKLAFYGYEEDPPAGDTSVDTTFTSIMNTPQTIGANVYVDGSLGETFTNRVTGPTVSNTHTTYVSAEKYWELSGNVESNVTIEANTFLEGDQPHAVSVWFNSSNLEANVSNTCVLSISDQEHLNSENLDLQSNTWHNLTYAYQGEGGSRVTYLDGRKVAEDRAEDTFGDYPPFAMTGPSQGGYVVSTSGTFDNSAGYAAHNVFSKSAGPFWFSGQTYSNGQISGSSPTFPGTSSKGEWVQLEMPHKLKVSYIRFWPRATETVRLPIAGTIWASNTGKSGDWVNLHSWSGMVHTDFIVGWNYMTVNASKYYKYFALQGHASSCCESIAISQLEYYGHRENDLVRLPDPTNVLKYPHVAMTGPAQRGYVASASTTYSLYEPWEAFNGVSDVGGNNYWSGANSLYSGSTPFNFTGSGDPYETSVSGTTYTGDWLQIELPHRIRVDHVLFNVITTARFPRQGVYAGSNDGSTWFELHTFSGLTTTDEENRVPSSGSFNGSSASNAYKYIRLIITHNNGNGYAACDELKIFGTGVDSIPIQIGGGNIDKVANFRVYDKFIGEDQALEIWDAQKDTFRGVKNSVTLHKGRLGIGTTEPEGRLAVLDEPDPDAYGLQKFPPKPLVGYKTHIEGHGEFCVSASVDSSPNYYPSYVFDQDESSILYWEPFSGGARYSTSSPGDYLKSNRLAAETQLGEYLVLKLPYKIKLEHFTIQRQVGGWWVPQEIYYYAKSEDEDTWEQIYYHGSIFGSYANSAASSDGSDAPIRRDVNSNKFYRYFALVITKGNGGAGVSLADWRLFGYREQLPPKQSVLHDGQLTLTKSLTVPRIGPALDADDTPRRDRLVVEYNTSTNPTFEGAVRDTSGRGLDAILRDATYDATDKSIRVGTSQDIILEQGIPGKSGDVTNVSYSIWFKADDVSADNQIIMTQISAYAVGVGLTLALNTNELQFGYGYAYSSGQQLGGAVLNAISAGQWYHVVAIKKGSGTLDATTLPDILEIYINGEKKTLSHGGGTGTLNVGTDHWLIIGAIRKLLSGRTSEEFIGNVSSIKYYDCALTAEEAKKLYDMGRCDEGHHVVNFSKTRVGIGLGDGEAPRGALDVRGDLYLSGNIIRNTLSAKSGGVWLPTYQFEVGGSTFVEDQRHGQYHIVNNVLTAVYRARVVSNSGAGTIRPSLPGGHKVAGVASGSTVAIGWWARNLDFGAANVGPYMLSDTTNGYIQPFHPGQTNNQVRLDGGSLEADTYWTMFLSYPIE